jgi:hypothetical protein
MLSGLEKKRLPAFIKATCPSEFEKKKLYSSKKSSSNKI